MEVPARFVEKEPLFRDFLERRKPIGHLNLKSEGSGNLIQLLIGQGCITYDGTRDAYQMDELEYVLHALIFQWYGIYYGHPFWARLSNCQVSIQELFGWALRTYHLSRSAGVTAARGAVYAPTSQIRAAFLASAIEEYSHCDTFFFPRHPVFGLEDSWIKQLVPLASSTAFDNQMSIIAEDDWLAHTCIAYFQEYTVAFRENAFALYDRLEKAYGLDGFFEGWKQHIGYDLEQSHAD